ncbi:hypothetical protein RI129_001428 [Pyrocoelia pectoralis]|uniref:EF-hand domain-containing protein n=1 Tax=Pyrocoelia pectoralis TaxID=417401 RepID=A0AAN7VVI7_9COLE
MLSKFVSGIVEDDVDEQSKKIVSEKLYSVSARSDSTSSNSVKQVKKPISLTQTSIVSERWSQFQQMESKGLGKISAKELQDAFLTFQGKHFSDASCKFVVRLFDLDRNGGLDVPEFETLYSYIKQWVTAFNNIDKNRTGFLDETQFDLALREMDINFGPDFIKFLITRNDPNCKKVSLDQFIVICVQIQRFTDEFKERDTNLTGKINLKYEDFLEIIMKCV